jgi:hypothetical protein
MFYNRTDTFHKNNVISEEERDRMVHEEALREI